MTPLATALERIDSLTTPDDWQVAATCRGLMIGYDARWRDDQQELELLESEICYVAPLTNLETSHNSRTYKLSGVLDKLVRDAGGLVLYDHKTTSLDIGDPTLPYWRQLAVDSQASHYELLLLANGIRLDGIVWDVIRKPGIRPKQIAQKDLKQLHATGYYFGQQITAETLRVLETTPRENGELYTARLAAETIGNPDRYFARRSNPRTHEQLAEYASELWGAGKLIRQSEIQEQHYRNSGACFNYGNACKFLGLCSGVDTPESDNWQLKPKKHAELPEDIGGANILTHSRLRTFQTCRRKHYYEYELQIERADESRTESLFFGSLFHEALDAWWNAFTSEEEHGDSNEQPISSIGSQAAQLA